MVKNFENTGRVPEDELLFTFARSSGAGGQNVNKTSTKAVVHWPVGESRAFSPEEKERIRIKLANRLNNMDELVVMSEEERSQFRNRDSAAARLQDLVDEALRVPKKRRPTRPSKTSKMKRLESKKIRSQLKAERRGAIEY